MQSKVEKVILSVLKEMNETYFDQPLDITKETLLLGGDGVLDSMATMNFLVSLEDAIADEFDIEIALADPKLIKDKKQPLKNVESIVNHIAAQIELKG